MPNNPYIEKVKNSDLIFSDEDVFLYKWKWKEKFWNKKNIVLEIGTWLWNFFSDEVSSFPENDYIWIELKYKRLYKTQEKTLEKGWKDFFLLKCFGQDVKNIFEEWELSKTYILFPDPWWKKERQKKHRLLQKTFLEDLFFVTKPEWKCIIKTDHEEYAKFIFQEIQETHWEIELADFDYHSNKELFDKTRMTEFETIFKNKDHKMAYFILKK